MISVQIEDILLEENLQTCFGQFSQMLTLLLSFICVSCSQDFIPLKVGAILPHRLIGLEPEGILAVI